MRNKIGHIGVMMNKTELEEINDVERIHIIINIGMSNNWK